MKIKRYFVYIAGSIKFDEIEETTVLKAAKRFIEKHGLNAIIEKYSDEYCGIRLKGNYSIASDYVIIAE